MADNLPDKLPGHTRSANERTSERNAGFLVEALLLLAFLIVALAIFVQLFSQASRAGAHSAEVNRAVLLASNVAEQFASNPTTVSAETTSEGLTASCTVNPRATERGTLYQANIVVTNEEGETVYSLQSANYQGGGAR
ncbi:MAG: hypothetical protein IJ125_09900 [Atopobiaceae bacterium]|nr:hypothetical protein [Atopobiaceae bacterium]